MDDVSVSAWLITPGTHHIYELDAHLFGLAYGNVRSCLDLDVGKNVNSWPDSTWSGTPFVAVAMELTWNLEHVRRQL